MKDFGKVIENLQKESKEQETFKFNKIRAKVLTMGRISLMLKNVKENKELIEKAKEASGTTKLPPGLLGLNKEDATNEIEHFIEQN